MAELKTRPTEQNIDDFLSRVEDPVRRQDAERICRMMQRITRRKPQMWGTSIVGFGAYRYSYASGRTGEWPLTGFSPRKQALTLYIMSGFDEYNELLDRLGKYRTGKSCLYLKRLDQVDEKVLVSLIRRSVAHLRKTWPTR
jgi:hypothetical protein